MIRSTHFILLAILAFSTGTRAQTSFESAEKTFSTSTDQWICRDLVRTNQSDFDCNRHGDKPIIPNGRPEMSAGRKDSLAQLYFPSGVCTRYLQLHALCDLYFPLFEKKLATHHLPDHFKYLPLVISGLNPQYTDSRGRGGIWGLDFLVARSVHLRVDSLIDERRGGDFTTDSALDHLEKLYAFFDGDEEKTLTAWQFSIPFVRSEDWLEDGRVTFFLDLFYFTEELFRSNPTDNQLDHAFEILGQYESIFFTRPVELNALAEWAGIVPTHFHETNPVYVGPYVEANYRRVPLILPAEQAVKARSFADSIYAWKAPVAALVVSEEAYYYRVKNGDSLGKIAERLHVSISDIRKWNHLKKDRIYAGQQLILYRSTKTAPSPLPQKPAEKTESDSQKIHDPARDESVLHYTVREGDSLWKIANKYKGVSPEDIMKWNQCSADIRPGQVLLLHIRK